MSFYTGNFFNIQALHANHLTEMGSGRTSPACLIPYTPSSHGSSYKVSLPVSYPWSIYLGLFSVGYC